MGAGGAAGAEANRSASGSTYHLEGVKNPNQYNNKQVEVIGMISGAGKSGEQILRVTKSASSARAAGRASPGLACAL